jgi:hypothetical protein
VRLPHQDFLQIVASFDLFQSTGLRTPLRANRVLKRTNRITDVISTNLVHTASILRPLTIDGNGETVPQIGKARQYPRTLTDSESVGSHSGCLETLASTCPVNSNSHARKLGMNSGTWTTCQNVT